MKIEEVATDKQLSAIEENLLKERLLCFQGITNPYGNPKTLKGNVLTLKNIFLLNRKYKTTFAESGEIQCGENHKRSQGDLFLIMRYYRPTITFKQFRKALFNLMNGNMVFSVYCSDIHKRTFWKVNRSVEELQPDTTIFSYNTVDELGFTLNNNNPVGSEGQLDMLYYPHISFRI
jgi:hypothetical protein